MLMLHTIHPIIEVKQGSLMTCGMGFACAPDAHDGGPANVGELGRGLAPWGAGQQDAMWSNHINGGKHDDEEDHNILGLDILVAL